MSTFTEYRDQARAADKQTWLGMLAWHSVSESTVEHAEVARQLFAVGLERFTPAAPKDDDVFRRIFYNGQRRKLDTDNPEIFEHLLVREVVRAEGRIVKRVVIETVNSADVSLGFREATDIVFNVEHPQSVSITPLGGPENIRGSDLAHELAAEYLAIRGSVDARAIREIVRQVLAAAMATAVRPGGGVYFVPMGQAPLLESLEEVAAHLPGCSVHSLPLVSEPRQREMLRKAFEAESIEAVDKTMMEVASLLKSDRKVSVSRFTALMARQKTLVARSAEYSSLLEQSLETTDDRLKILQLQLGALGAKVGQ